MDFPCAVLISAAVMRFALNVPLGRSKGGHDEYVIGGNSSFLKYHFLCFANF